MRDPLSSAVNAFVGQASQTLMALQPAQRARVALDQALAPAMAAMASELALRQGPAIDQLQK